MAPNVKIIPNRVKKLMKIGDLMVHSNMISFDFSAPDEVKDDET